MKKYIFTAIFTLGLALGGLAMPLADNVSAASQKINCGASGCANTGAGKSKGNGQSGNLAGNNGIFETVTNILLFLAGTISVIMIVVGGIKYVISNGDSNAVTGAKNTIMYAVVGLVVTIIAYALVRFVISALV